MRFFVVVLVAVVALVAVARSQETDSCRADVASLTDRVIRLERSDPDNHAAMLQELRRMKVRHALGPADCRSEMITEEIALVNFLERTEEAIQLSDAYLSSDLADAHPAHRGFVLRVRGYAREALGETAAGARDYFAAAALADKMPVGYAIQALLDAAETAIAIGRFDEATGYYEASERVLRDSLTGRPTLDLRLGRLYTAQASLIAHQLERDADADAQRRLATSLQATATQALEKLAIGCSLSCDPRIDDANEALAWSARALADAVLGDADAAGVALREASRLLARSQNTSRDAGFLVWIRAHATHRRLGQSTEARRAALRARDAGQRTGIITQEAAAWEALAAIDEADGRFADAETHYRTALALREVERERLTLQDWSLSAFAESQAPYRGLVRLLARQGRGEEAFTLLDQSRARHLRDLRSHAALRTRLSPGDRATADSLLTEIEFQRLRRLHDPSARVQADVAVRISDLQSLLQEKTPLDASAQPLDIGALRETLGRQQRTLVSYFLDAAGGFAFVVRPDGLTVRPLAATDVDVNRLMASARGPWAASPDPALALAPLYRLHQALMQPIGDLLPAGEALVIVPDGPLADLPFGLLLEAPAESFARARYVVRSHAISTELAAALLLEPERRSQDPASTVDLVAFGRSRFEGEPGDRRSAEFSGLLDLPHVEREVRRVASHVRRASVSLNDRATETDFLRLLSSSRVVHLASHAEADPAFPMHARIHLWPSDNDDGVLHLYEMQSISTPADLIVLSGCTTAGGPTSRGEGTLGLQYGLRAAGAGSTLATLWPVDDRATADVMDHFYRALADGLTKDRALQAAQIAYLDAQNGLASSPYYWGAFVLSGDTGAVPLQRPSSPLPALLVGVLALSGLAWVLAQRRRRVRRPSPL